MMMMMFETIIQKHTLLTYRCSRMAYYSVCMCVLAFSLQLLPEFSRMKPETQWSVKIVQLHN